MKTKTAGLVVALMCFRLMAADEAAPARRPAAEGLNRPQARLGAGPGGAGNFEQVLTDGQRQKLREYMQADAAKLRASQQELMRLRRELQEAVMTGKAEEAVIRQKTEAIGKLEGEVLALRMNALAKVAASLTPEQKDRIKEMSEQMRTERPGLGARPREGDAPRTREPAAPPPPDK